MKFLLTLIIALSAASLPAFGEETKISAGMPVAEVKAALAKNGYAYGSQFQLQWYEAGFDYVFCRLDAELTLAVKFSVKKKEVSEILVNCPAPKMDTRADAVILRPTLVVLSPSAYSLVFKKEANQASEPTAPSGRGSP